jgi:flagellar hook-associated protein 2
MGDIRFSGLASGIDTQSLIDKLIQLERRPITKIQSEIKDNNAKLDRLRALNTKLKALDAAAAKVMGSKGSATSPLSGLSATMSDATVGTMTATSSAPKGTYTIQVTAVAATGKVLGGLTGRAATATVAGTFTSANTYRIKLDGDANKSVDITLDSTSTLASIASAINGSTTSPVTATITNATASESRLVLISKTNGAAGTFTISALATEVNTGPKLAAFGIDVSAAPVTGTGFDASIKIDGSTVTGPTNTFVDALPGTTFTALKIGTTSATIDNDLAGAKGAVKDLVARYNEVVAQLREDTRYDATSQRSGPLRGEATIRGLAQALNRMITDTFDTSGDNGTFTNYKAAGLSVSRDGSLTLDEKVFDEAVKANPGYLYALFSNEDNEVSGDVSLNQGAGASSMGDGLANRLRALVSSATDLASPYNGMSPSGGRSPGVVLGAINAATRANTRFNDRIDSEERRVARRERLLRLQFQNMERAISGLKSQGSYMSSQIASLQGQQG